MYFMMESVGTISNHIMSLYAAKMFAFTKQEDVPAITLEKEREDGAIYIHSSQPGISQIEGPAHEKK